MHFVADEQFSITIICLKLIYNIFKCFKTDLEYLNFKYVMITKFVARKRGGE